MIHNQCSSAKWARPRRARVGSGRSLLASAAIYAVESLESRRLLSTIYVDANSPDPAGNGSSWAHAYRDLQQAIPAPPLPGQPAAAVATEIHVADGRYKPTSGITRTVSFPLRDGVSILGGYAGYGAPNPDLRDLAHNFSILSGEIGDQVTMSDNSIHVVAANGVASTAVLDGFTVTAGNANIEGAFTLTNDGGGIFIKDASPTINNCLITNNAADNLGAGAANFDGTASPHFNNCVFRGNVVANAGSGLESVAWGTVVTNCTFSGNTTTGLFFGGGVIQNVIETPGPGLQLINCILWNDIGGELSTKFDAPIITYSDIQGGFAGTGNINANPQFISATDLHLPANSPCIDAGNNAAISAGIATDLDGGPRIVDTPGVHDPGAIVDMGAYEFPDTTPPTITARLPAAGSTIGAASFNVDLTFSKIVVGVDATDLVLTGPAAGSATVSAPSNIIGNTWRFPVSGLISGGMNVSLAPDPNDIEDQSGVDLVNSTWIYFIDVTPPTITAESPSPGSYIGSSSFNLDLTFSETVASVDSTDLVLTGSAAGAAIKGTPTNISGNTWRFPVSGLVGGTLNISLAPDANDIEDLYGNDLASATWTYAIDIAPPTIIAEAPAPSSFITISSFFLDLQFSEPVMGVDSTDLVLSGGAAGAAIKGAASNINGNTWRFPISGLVDGALNISLAPDPNGIEDVAGNDLANTTWNYTIDLTAPTITARSPTPSSTISTWSPNIDVTFSEPVMGVDVTDLVLSGSAAGSASKGTPSNISGNTWRFPVSGLVDGTLNISFAPDPNDIEDLVGHDLVNAVWSYNSLGAIYVDDSAPGPTHDGTSWTTAYTDLQDGLASASPGNQIRVAQGTYKPTATTDRTISFVLKNGVSLLGGYAGYGVANPDARDVIASPTMLSGAIGSGGNSDNTYNIVLAESIDATGTIDGFTIENANATGGNGGGMFVRNGGPTIRNCIFQGNAAMGMYIETASPTVTGCTFTNTTGIGVRIYYASPMFADCSITSNSEYGIFSDTSTATLTNSTFTNNGASGLFAGGSTFHLLGCTFFQNTFQGISSGGGAINGLFTSLLLDNCTFEQNSTNQLGGAIYTEGSPAFELTNCIFRGNSGRAGAVANMSSAYSRFVNCQFINNKATALGGAIYTLQSWSTNTIIDCTFEGNTSSHFGGAVENDDWSTFINCQFMGNSAAEGGGAINNRISATLINCTLAYNTASAGGAVHDESVAPSPITISNSVMWGNIATTGSQIAEGPGTPDIAHSDSQGGFAGTGNIDADPLFIRNPSPGPDNTWGTADDDYGDLHLQSGSPCIDAGDNSSVPADVTTDLDGNPRIMDEPGVHDPGFIVDMGAYEFVPVFQANGFNLGQNAPQFGLSFNLDIDPVVLSLDTDDIELSDLSDPLATLPAVTSVHFDPTSHVTTWSLAGWLDDGNYSVKLKAGSVTALTGTSLPADNIQGFFILLADANHDRYVNTLDFTALAANFGQSGKSYADGDFNYDGTVNSLDFNALASKFGAYLGPAAGGLPVAGSTPALGLRLQPGSLFSRQSIDSADVWKSIESAYAGDSLV